MKTRVTTVIIIFVVLVFSIVGCSTEKSGDIVQVARVAPEDTYWIYYYNLEIMGEDPDFAQMYDLLIDFHGSGAEGIKVSDVSGFAFIFTKRGSLSIQIGKFDIKDVINKLEGQGYTTREYQGIEILTHNAAFTFLDNMLLNGYKDG